jgi:hypothetical protein
VTGLDNFTLPYIYRTDRFNNRLNTTSIELFMLHLALRALKYII